MTTPTEALRMAVSYIKGDKAWVHLQDEVLAACEEALVREYSQHSSIATGRDEIYYAWRKHWGYGIPSKHGEAVFNANGDGFQAGWLACEKWIKEKQNDHTN